MARDEWGQKEEPTARGMKLEFAALALMYVLILALSVWALVAPASA